MSNLQRASQTPSAPTLIQTSRPADPIAPAKQAIIDGDGPAPAPGFLYRKQGDLAKSQLTGVNVPEGALGGKPFVAVNQGKGRTDYVSTNTTIADALDKDRAVPIERSLSPRDDRAIDRLFQNQQGTTNKEILSTPSDYHDAVVGRNYIEGGGVNGMSPTAFGQNPTPGDRTTARTPSVGNERTKMERLIAENEGYNPTKHVWTGDRGDQGSTAMLAKYRTPNADEVWMKGTMDKALREGFNAQTPAASVTGDPAQEKIRAIIRRQETGSFDGDYAKQNKGHGSSASGAYQFVDKTWRAAARDAGVGTEYKRAYMAPKEVQDKVFDNYFGKLMSRTKGDLYKAVNIHFTGNPEGAMSAAAKRANPTINAQGYRKSIQAHEAEYDRLKNTIARR